jgi:hypothetical protein
MDMDALFARKVADRTAQGLVSMGGIACPTQEWLDYYNARHLAPRDREGFAVVALSLIKLKARAVASTTA